MIGRKAEIVLNRAVRFAVEQDHEYFTLEHVLWSLLRENEIVEIIDACGGEPVRMRTELEGYLETEIPRTGVPEQAESPDSSASPSPDEELSASESGEDVDPDQDPDQEMDASGEAEEGESEGRDEAGWEHPIATLSIQRLIQSALFHVQSAGKDEIRPADLLVALFQARDSHALHLLSKQGIDRLDVLNFISHGIQKDENRTEEAPSTDLSPQPTSIPGKPAPNRSSDDPLVLYARNLNERAEAGKVDPLIGRKNEVERIVQTLCRRQKSNPLLVGEAGVGKTALAEGLAERIVRGEVPEHLSNAVVYALDLGALLAGAKFRGDFEQRLKKVLVALQKQREQGHEPILLIDEIHTIIGAGAVSGGALDAANLLKPVLGQGELRCIGSTTYQEYRNVFEKDHALARRFQKIDVPEPSVEEAVQILNGLKERYEKHHGVRYSAEALRAAVELSSKHLTDRFLPDKAIDVIDEAGAKARLKSPDKKREKDVLIGAEAIEEVIAQIARIPAKSVSVTQKTRLKSLERDLKFTIYGQDHAIEALVTSIRLARSGLRTAERPVGAFLFCGPTGVGKTELSKQLSQCLGVPFLRFDMSEYSEKHTVSRLIGAPPGYVGFEQAGMLTDAVLKNPHSVVLLDEIEKAHGDIWNILLQVMDHGFLTDNNGRKADFRNAILILTSNVGSRDLERRPLGVGPQETDGLVGSTANDGSGAKKAVEQTFSPEFRNRLDGIVYFNSLDPVAVGHVVGKQLLELESQLLAKSVDIEIGPDVRDWLARKGYDRRMGARPMARLIQDYLKKPLAEEILFGRLESGGRVKVSMSGEQVDFEFMEKTAVVREKASSREPESLPVSPGTRSEG
ncbi:MAG: hypothetical protein A2X94_13270 [Bdellovibrionales bacterium GWB1_55_8]|nr:MAG: hypothetical protein A2X94_13270 [Bdellovibrionales bacterium GWB1_55_8]